MNRRDRQGAILRLIREREISTQGELVQALRAEGHEVVQTTVSRDVHELGLVKARMPSGKLVYVAAEDAAAYNEELTEALQRWALSLEPSGNLVVVLTPYGYSSALAQAIDSARNPHVAGSIAGENTVLLVAREPATGAQLAGELSALRMRGAA